MQMITDTQDQAHAAWLLAHKREKQKIRGLQLLLLAGLLFCWEAAARLGWIDTFLFSSPSAVGRIFWIYFSNGTIWMHIGITMWETFVGFCIGTVCACHCHDAVVVCLFYPAL